MQDEVIYLGWPEIEQSARALADALGDGPPISGLIAIARGGLIPAALVARDLGLRVIESIAVITYEDREAGAPRLLKPAAVADQGEGWVIVDDLVDRGHTARFVRALLPRARFVCLYAKPEGRPYVDIVVREYPQNTWLKFPWETA